MPTNTSNYTLSKPLVNSATDQDIWGNELNSDLDSIDTLLRSGITMSEAVSQTTGFTASASISVKNLYPCDATGGAFNATIPSASSSGNGAIVAIKKTDVSVNAVGIARTGSDTLDGATSLSLANQNDCFILVSDGISAWSSIAKPSNIVPAASTSVPGIIQIATNAEVKTGTNSLKAVVPSSMTSHLGVAKAWIRFNGSAGTTLATNGATFTKNSTGNYTITLSPVMADINYCVVANASLIGTRNLLMGVSTTPSTSTFNLLVTQDDGIVADCTYGSIVIFGN